MKLLQSFFALKLSDRALILSLIPHRVAQKCNFMYDYANDAGLIENV